MNRSTHVTWFFRFFRRRKLEAQLDSELRFHIEQQTANHIAAGMNPAEARRRALAQFGGLESRKEEAREARGTHLLESLWQDIRFSFRMLRRNPAVSILAVLCLTLGIGANAAVFSWIEGLLIRPFPAVSHQERMYALAGSAPSDPDDPDLSWPDFLDLQRNSKLVESFIGDKIMGASLNIGGRADRATGSIVSANYFDALGIRPILGRGFRPGEDTGHNAHPVTVISYQMWQNTF